MLPRAVEGQMHPLETWYRENVMGGNGAFVLPANGYGDFGRAIRQKFVVEISGAPAPYRYSDAGSPTRMK